MIEYYLVTLRNPLRADAIRKLRGAVGQAMLDYAPADAHQSRREWNYGHGEGPLDKLRVPEIAFRLGEDGLRPEVVVRRASGAAAMDLLCATPFVVLLGRKTYTVAVDEVRLVSLPFCTEGQVFSYRLVDVAPFNRSSYPSYLALRRAHGYTEERDYVEVEHEALIDLITRATQEHALRACEQLMRVAEIESAKLDMDAREDAVPMTEAVSERERTSAALWPQAPGNLLLYVRVDGCLTHRRFFGSGNNAFSVFNGLRIDTNMRLPHHWGLGHERVHGVGGVQQIDTL